MKDLSKTFVVMAGIALALFIIGEAAYPEGNPAAPGMQKAPRVMSQGHPGSINADLQKAKEPKPAENKAKWSQNPNDEREQGNMGKPTMRDPYGFDKDSDRVGSERGRVIRAQGGDFTYYITRLTNTSIYDSNPRIGDNGYIVWQTTNPYEIYRYDGSSVTQITSDTRWDGWSQINANGDVVWQRGRYGDSPMEIMLYDGSLNVRIALLQQRYGAVYPQISDNGYIAWAANDGWDDEIYLYDGSTIIQLTDNRYSDRYLQINANGDLVWQREYSTGNYDIFLYDGSSVVQITDDIYCDENAKINESGYIVWTKYRAQDSEIYLYNGSTTIRLTDNDYQDSGNQINANGQVVWEGFDGHDFEIFFFNGSTTIQLTDNDYDDVGPQINDSGFVVWEGELGDNYTSREIFLYNGSTTTQLTANDYYDYDPLINANGDIVWVGNGDIFVAEVSSN